MDLAIKCFLLVIAYLMGNIPFGLLLTSITEKSRLQTQGSGNIGATNVLRVYGKKAAFLTLIGDVGKGVLSVFFMSLYSEDMEWQTLAAFCVVLGHIFPVFRKGKGGKGVATGFGVLITLDIGVALTTFLIWVLVLGIWRYSSLGALVAFTLLPIVVLIMQDNSVLLLYSFSFLLLILFSHWSNIKRLWAREEKRIGLS